MSTEKTAVEIQNVLENIRDTNGIKGINDDVYTVFRRKEIITTQVTFTISGSDLISNTVEINNTQFCVFLEKVSGAKRTVRFETYLTNGWKTITGCRFVNSLEVSTELWGRLISFMVPQVRIVIENGAGDIINGWVVQ